jgi:hypothetical protein
MAGSQSITSVTRALCPDLLGLSDLGVADGLRGRVVRGFFWLLEIVWRVRGTGVIG